MIGIEILLKASNIGVGKCCCVILFESFVKIIKNEYIFTIRKNRINYISFKLPNFIYIKQCVGNRQCILCERACTVFVNESVLVELCTFTNK